MSAPSLPDPQPGYRWVIDAPENPRRRSAWPWIVSIVVIAALAVGAWFAGEWLARDIVERTISTQVIESLGLPADQQVDVEVDGSVIPQLIGGTLDDVRIASEDVAFGSFAGDVSVEATGIPIRGDGPMDAAAATVTLDQTQLRTLLSTVEGFPADTVGLDAPEVTMSVDLSVFALTVPVGVGLTPGADQGDITLTPTTLSVAEASVSADTLRSQFGVVADLALRTWDVCIAQYLPVALTLSEVTVTGDRLVADFGIDGAILNDSSVRELGTCA